MPTTIATENTAIYPEEQLEVCDEDGRDNEEVVELEKQEFIQVMLKIHQANSSPKWRSMVRNAKMEK